MSNYINQHDGFSQEISREFFRSVYSYMVGALAVSGIIAYWAGTPEFFAQYFISASGGIAPLFYVVAFAPMGLGLLIQMGYKRLSLGALMGLYLLFAVLMGLSLGSIFLVYSGQSIAITFFVTAGAFAGMAILGYTTKTDLTKMGSLLYMAFIGIFIAGIVNIWMKSEMMSFVISVIGVFVFTGLTAYYMQQLKDMSSDTDLSGLDRSKLAIVGGLILYITFINLFLSLLRIMGSRD
ncbi:MAG: Bax inhibitor-1/YccA family protein [Crocinitomicaceae bacterium]